MTNTLSDFWPPLKAPLPFWPSKYTTYWQSNWKNHHPTPKNYRFSKWHPSIARPAAPSSRPWSSGLCCIRWGGASYNWPMALFFMIRYFFLYCFEHLLELIPVDHSFRGNNSCHFMCRLGCNFAGEWAFVRAKSTFVVAAYQRWHGLCACLLLLSRFCSIIRLDWLNPLSLRLIFFCILVHQSHGL